MWAVVEDLRVELRASDSAYDELPSACSGGSGNSVISGATGAGILVGIVAGSLIFVALLVAVAVYISRFCSSRTPTEEGKLRTTTDASPVDDPATDPPANTISV